MYFGFKARLYLNPELLYLDDQDEWLAKTGRCNLNQKSCKE